MRLYHCDLTLPSIDMNAKLNITKTRSMCPTWRRFRASLSRRFRGTSCSSMSCGPCSAWAGSCVVSLSSSAHYFNPYWGFNQISSHRPCILELLPFSRRRVRIRRYLPLRAAWSRRPRRRLFRFRSEAAGHDCSKAMQRSSHNDCTRCALQAFSLLAGGCGCLVCVPSLFGTGAGRGVVQGTGRNDSLHGGRVDQSCAYDRRGIRRDFSMGPIKRQASISHACLYAG